MNAAFKGFFLLIPLMYIQQLFSVVPYLDFRSQSSNTALEIAGWAHYIDIPSNGENYGTFAIAPGYGRSFRSNNILNCLFGNSLVNDGHMFRKKSN